MINGYQSFAAWSYAQLTLLIAIGSFVLGILLLFLAVKSKSNKPLHNIWCMLCLAIGGWNLGYFFTMIPEISLSNALIASRISHASGILIVPLYLQFSTYLRPSYFKNKKLILATCYITCSCIALLCLTPFIVTKLTPKLFLHYYPVGKIGYALYVFFFITWVAYAHIILIKAVKESTGLTKYQIKYFMLGTIPGFIGGATCFPLIFGFKLSPYLSVLILFYLLTTPYAIFKYRLMDINIALTRAGIFLFVYSIILGIPFYLGYKFGLWKLATWVTVILAPLGPIIYTRLRHQAEARILKEERKIQEFLIQASSGMTTIRDSRKLLRLIIRLVSKALKTRLAAIYLFDKENKQYVLKASRFSLENNNVIAIDDPLIQHLQISKTPLLFEEIRIKSENDNNMNALKGIVSRMNELQASIILPTIVQDDLLGFLILGEGSASRMYSAELISAMAILSNQAALALENARFYEAEKENQALLYQSATLAQLGTMADSMGHQIKNHIQKMMSVAGAEAGMLEEYLKQDLSLEKANELLQKYLESFSKIENQGKVSKEIIESISKYSRLPLESFKQISIGDMIHEANDILQFKIHFSHFDYTVDIENGLPSLYAHPMLKEAFINLIDNAYDAIKERETRLNESGYRGKISFQARNYNQSHIEIKISDNGMGIDKRILQNLFVPFYTTKATANKGTGLGLFVIKMIVDNHSGKITVESERQKGTCFTILLPIKEANGNGRKEPNA